MGRLRDRRRAEGAVRACGLLRVSVALRFGLPPLEAMRCGCPVIVSHEGALPEVCGGAALFCDAYSPPDIAAAIARVMDDPELRARLRTLGREHAHRYSWQRSAHVARHRPCRCLTCDDATLRAGWAIPAASATGAFDAVAILRPSPVPVRVGRVLQCTLIPVNTRVQWVYPASNAFGTSCCRAPIRTRWQAMTPARRAPARHRAPPCSARNPEQERPPCRSTHNNGRR